MITAAEILAASKPFKYAVDEEVQETRKCHKCGALFNYHKHSRHTQCWACRKKKKHPSLIQKDLDRKRIYSQAKRSSSIIDI